MAEKEKRQKTIVIGAGPVGALAALYAAQRGHDVEVYELRSGASILAGTSFLFIVRFESSLEVRVAHKYEKAKTLQKRAFRVCDDF